MGYGKKVKRICNKHHKIIESITTEIIKTNVDYECLKLVMNNILRTFQIAHFNVGE